MLRTGIEQGGGSGKMTEVADRREAVGQALGSAKKGDMVLITGMGHEQPHRQWRRLPWNDTAAVSAGDCGEVVLLGG